MTKTVLLISTLLLTPLLNANDDLAATTSKIKNHLSEIQKITVEYLNTFTTPELDDLSKEQLGIQTLTEQIKTTSSKLGGILHKVGDDEKAQLKKMEEALSDQDQPLIQELALKVLNARLEQIRADAHKLLVEMSEENPSEYTRKYGERDLEKLGKNFALTRAKIAKLSH